MKTLFAVFWLIIFARAGKIASKKSDNLPPHKRILNGRKLPVIPELPQELSSKQIELFLVNQWDEIAPNHHQKHREYAAAVVKILMDEAPSLRNSKLIKQLSDLLHDADKYEDIFCDKENFMSVKSYDEKKLSSVRKVVQSLESMKLNKFALFNELCIWHNIVDDVRYPGIYALKNTFSAHPPANNIILSRINKVIAGKYQRPVDQAVSDFIRVNREDIEFLYPEYKHFFAAEYIITELKIHSDKLKYIIKTILSNSKYSQVAEYLDLAMMNPDRSELLTPTIEKIVQGSKLFPKRSFEVLEKVLDNALSHGFDNIAAAVTENKAKKSKIEKYFMDENGALLKIAPKGKYQSNPMLSTAQKTGNFERLEMLFKKNMENTIKTLMQIDMSETKTKNKKKINSERKSIKSWLVEKWSNYLKESFLTQSEPNLKIYNIMKPHGKLDLPVDELNKLTYEAVRHGGLRNKPIVHDLYVSGAKPTEVIVEGETLVHIALKHQDLDLLKYVVEQLHVPIADRPGIKSILSTILDTNPFPRYSPPQFWETLQYTLQNGKIDVPHSSLFDRLDQKSFNPSLEDTISLTYSILTETDRQTVAESILQLELSHGVENVSPGLKNYRKNFVLSIVQPDSPDSLTLRKSS